MANEEAPASGRRERKKAQTRQALHEAAMRLFAEKGYRETRVADITEAADVSEATFFRYFASKEEAALTELMTAIQGVLAALKARPLDEPPLTACRALVRSASAADLVPGPRYALLAGLVIQDRGLAGYFFGEMARVTGRLAVDFAKRLGMAPTDLKPQLLAAGVIGALEAVLVHWLSDPLGTDPLAAVDEAFELLAKGLE